MAAQTLEEKTIMDSEFFQTDIIEIDFKAVSAYFQRLIQLGSKRFILTADEINAYGVGNSRVNDPTMNQLLMAGTLFMDAIAFKALPLSKRPQYKSESNLDVDVKESGHLLKVARALYFFYFMYMVRGSVPPKETVLARPAVPQFLMTTMKLSGTVEEQEVQIASFSMEKVSPEWIRFVTIPGLGVETKQRLTLQLAGYRLFKPLQFAKPDKQVSAEVSRALEAVKNFMARGPVWSVHSVTRSAAVSAKLGPINANLGNLMLECFSDGLLEKFKKDQLIFKKPTESLNAYHYKTWTDASFAQFTDYVFPPETTF